MLKAFRKLITFLKQLITTVLINRREEKISKSVILTSSLTKQKLSAFYEKKTRECNTQKRKIMLIVTLLLNFPAERNARDGSIVKDGIPEELRPMLKTLKRNSHVIGRFVRSHYSRNVLSDGFNACYVIRSCTRCLETRATRNEN